MIFHGAVKVGQYLWKRHVDHLLSSHIQQPHTRTMSSVASDYTGSSGSPSDSDCTEQVTIMCEESVMYLLYLEPCTVNLFLWVWPTQVTSCFLDCCCIYLATMFCSVFKISKTHRYYNYKLNLSAQYVANSSAYYTVCTCTCRSRLNRSAGSGK